MCYYEHLALESRSIVDAKMLKGQRTLSWSSRKKKKWNGEMAEASECTFFFSLSVYECVSVATMKCYLLLFFGCDWCAVDNMPTEKMHLFFSPLLLSRFVYLNVIPTSNESVKFTFFSQCQHREFAHSDVMANNKKKISSKSIQLTHFTRAKYS